MPARGQRIVIIAGPNGAGKTTFAQEFLSSRATRPTFVNADLIAAGLSPFNPDAAAIRAGRLMLEEIHRHVAARESFAFETTLAGRGYVPMIRQWQAMGYRVELIFLKLDRPETAISRVAARVKQGGHGVPESTIRRRFESGLRNFSSLYAPLVDAWELYDNSGRDPVLLKRSNPHD